MIGNDHLGTYPDIFLDTLFGQIMLVYSHMFQFQYISEPGFWKTIVSGFLLFSEILLASSLKVLNQYVAFWTIQKY